eukprot:COSAG06_NODE_27657_length_589_cov_0.710204_1_plen_163_part_01
METIGPTRGASYLVKTWKGLRKCALRITRPCTAPQRAAVHAPSAGIQSPTLPRAQLPRTASHAALGATGQRAESKSSAQGLVLPEGIQLRAQAQALLRRTALRATRGSMVLEAIRLANALAHAQQGGIHTTTLRLATHILSAACASRRTCWTTSLLPTLPTRI